MSIVQVCPYANFGKGFTSLYRCLDFQLFRPALPDPIPRISSVSIAVSPLMYFFMCKIISDIVFMCRIFAEIHAKSILAFITGEGGRGQGSCRLEEGDRILYNITTMKYSAATFSIFFVPFLMWKVLI